MLDAKCLVAIVNHQIEFWQFHREIANIIEKPTEYVKIQKHKVAISHLSQVGHLRIPITKGKPT
jgi:hypothetical protein